MFEEERNLRSLYFLSVPYTLSVALAWALGYWRTFGINPFEYAGPAEIASLSAYALVASLSVLVVSIFFTQMFLQGPVGRALDKWIQNKVDEEFGAVPEPPSVDDCQPEELDEYQEKVNEFRNKLLRAELWQFLRRLVVTLALVFAIFSSYFQQSYIWLGIFAFSPIVVFILADPLPEKVKDALSRNVTAEIVLCFMLSLPMVSFLYGAQKSFSIMDGKGSMLLFDGESGEQLGGLYMGRLSDYIFTFNVCSGYVEVRKDDELPEFKLVPSAVTQCSRSFETPEGVKGDS